MLFAKFFLLALVLCVSLPSISPLKVEVSVDVNGNSHPQHHRRAHKAELSHPSNANGNGIHVNSADADQRNIPSPTNPTYSECYQVVPGFVYMSPRDQYIAMEGDKGEYGTDSTGPSFNSCLQRLGFFLKDMNGIGDADILNGYMAFQNSHNAPSSGTISLDSAVADSSDIPTATNPTYSDCYQPVPGFATMTADQQYYQAVGQGGYSNTGSDGPSFNSCLQRHGFSLKDMNGIGDADILNGWNAFQYRAAAQQQTQQATASRSAYQSSMQAWKDANCQGARLAVCQRMYPSAFQ